MDKYEFNIKVEQIKKLAAKKLYKEAADIARDMNWQKVKDWSVLATVINVQEAVGDYLEARDMAILAYNRNLGGRKLVYKLTELLIKLEDFENADELYEEYEKMSQHDVNRFILFYELRKAERASDNELVEILEDYKEHEIDEKYMYELAKLYSKTGRREECIKTCDDIVLWFQDGKYVERAIKLKQDFGVELTNTQKKILAAALNKKDDLEATREIMFEEQQQIARMQQDDVDEVLREDEQDKNASAKAARSDKKKHESLLDMFRMKEDDEEESDEDESDEEDRDNAAKDSIMDMDTDTEIDLDIDSDRDFEDHSETDEESEKESENESEEDLEHVSESELADAAQKTAPVEEKEQESDADSNKEVMNSESSDYNDKNQATQTSAPANGIDKASLSLKELIANAKKKIEDSCDQINREAELEKLEEEKKKEEEQRKLEQAEAKIRMEQRADAMNIEVEVPNFDIYDTQNIQQALAQNLSQMMKDDEEEIEALRPQPIAQPKSEQVADGQTDQEEAEEDDQIEGQLSLADWIETVREEKYGKQNTRKYSKAELDRMLDEKDEKSAAYEKLIAEQKAKAAAEGTEFDEAEARLKATAQMMLNAAKTDLVIRTGKATAKLEEAVAHLKEAAVDAEETVAGNDKSSPSDEYVKEYTATDETVSLDTAPIHPITDEILSSVREIMAEQKEEQQSVSAHGLDEEVQSGMKEISQEAKVSPEQNMDHSVEAESDATENKNSNESLDELNAMPEDNLKEDDSVLPFEEMQEDDDQESELVEKHKSHRHKRAREREKEREIIAAEARMEQDEEEEKKLSPELAKIFRKYREMPGLETQLVDYFDSIHEEMQMSTSSVGNIIISGNSSSDKTDLARTLIRAINYLYPEHPKKIAKTTGDSINHRGITKAMNKLKGTALIVEGAGSVQPKRINEIMTCLEQDTDRMIVIFEDSDTEMNVLLNFNPELPGRFNHRIVLKQYTVNELVEMARKFARKRQYEVDDDALLELYLKIDRLHNTNDNIKLDDIKEIINQAIIKSEKRASRRFFGGLKKKRGSNGDIFFLSEADFKD